MRTSVPLLHRTLTALAVSSLVACGGGDATTQGDVPDADTGSLGPSTGFVNGTGEDGDTSFAGALATAMCDWMVDCCNTLELEDILGGMAAIPSDAGTVELAMAVREDPSQCVALVKGFVAETLRHAEAAVIAERAAFDESAGAACLTHFAGDCGIGGAADITGDDHPCHIGQLVVGQVPVTGLCTDDIDCMAQTYCQVDLGDTFGTCRAWATVGSPCGDDATCGPGGYCGAAGTLGVCVTGGGQLAPYCNDHEDCADGQYCAASVGTCVEALSEGTVCQDHATCATGFCSLGATQLCEATRGLNDLCTSDAACGDEGFCDDAPPDVDRCVALTQLGSGERCDVGAAVCGEGLVCEDGLCVERSGIDGPCQNDAYCPSSGWCDNGTCVARSPVGGSCSNDGQCVAISWCSSGACVSRVEVNQPCDFSTRCAIDAYCELTDGVVGTCQPLPSGGSDCQDGVCASDFGCVTYTGTCTARGSGGADCDRDAMCNADLQCATPYNVTSVCQPPGIVGTGEPCTSPAVVCATGLYCDGNQCAAYAVAGSACMLDEMCVAGTSCVQGQCKTLGGAFGSCDSVPDCAAGLYCDMAVQQCTPQKTKDQSCSSDDECQGTLYCEAGSGTCDWKKGPSESCSQQGQCQDDLYCNIAGSCATRLGVGQTCNVDDACIEGLGCVDGLCTAPASPGMVCNPVMGCVEDASCDQTTNLCQALGGSGDGCDAHDDCISDLYCGSLSATCADRAVEGETCESSGECASGLSCQQSGLCRARSGVGEDCDPQQTQCVADALCDASGVCVGLQADRPIGEPCRHDAQCQTHRCEESVCVGHCQGGL